MYKVYRGKSAPDKKWLPVDVKSLNEFLERVNPFENRG